MKLQDIKAGLNLSGVEATQVVNVVATVPQGGPRKGSVGFALTALQRRLASSPEAIYQSLKRRRERPENRLRDETRTRAADRP